MGEGDVKLMVMIGAILGADSLPYIVCVSALLSTLAGLISVRQQNCMEKITLSRS